MFLEALEHTHTRITSEEFSMWSSMVDVKEVEFRVRWKKWKGSPMEGTTYWLGAPEKREKQILDRIGAEYEGVGCRVKTGGDEEGMYLRVEGGTKAVDGYRHLFFSLEGENSQEWQPLEGEAADKRWGELMDYCSYFETMVATEGEEDYIGGNGWEGVK